MYNNAEIVQGDVLKRTKNSKLCIVVDITWGRSERSSLYTVKYLAGNFGRYYQTKLNKEFKFYKHDANLLKDIQKELSEKHHPALDKPIKKKFTYRSDFVKAMSEDIRPICPVYKMNDYNYLRERRQAS